MPLHVAAWGRMPAHGPASSVDGGAPHARKTTFPYRTCPHTRHAINSCTRKGVACCGDCKPCHALMGAHLDCVKGVPHQQLSGAGRRGVVVGDGAEWRVRAGRWSGLCAARVVGRRALTGRHAGSPGSGAPWVAAAAVAGDGAAVSPAPSPRPCPLPGPAPWCCARRAAAADSVAGAPAPARGARRYAAAQRRRRPAAL